MTWEQIIAIIAQEGLPFAEMLFNKWTTGGTPTVADFADLRAQASQTALDRAKARLAAAGIPLTDQRAIDLLKLVGG